MNKWGVVAKAERVVKSCETFGQLRVAQRYCQLTEDLFSKQQEYFLFEFGIIQKAKQLLEKEYPKKMDDCVQLNDEINKIVDLIKKEVKI